MIKPIALLLLLIFIVKPLYSHLQTPESRRSISLQKAEPETRTQPAKPFVIRGDLELGLNRHAPHSKPIFLFTLTQLRKALEADEICEVQKMVGSQQFSFLELLGQIADLEASPLEALSAEELDLVHDLSWITADFSPSRGHLIMEALSTLGLVAFPENSGPTKGDKIWAVEKLRQSQSTDPHNGAFAFAISSVSAIQDHSSWYTTLRGFVFRFPSDSVKAVLGMRAQINSSYRWLWQNLKPNWPRVLYTRGFERLTALLEGAPESDFSHLALNWSANLILTNTSPDSHELVTLARAIYRQSFRQLFPDLSEPDLGFTTAEQSGIAEGEGFSNSNNCQDSR